MVGPMTTMNEAEFRAAHPKAELFVAYKRADDGRWLALLHLKDGDDRLLLTLETFNSDYTGAEVDPLVAAWTEYAIVNRIWETRQ